MESFMQAPLDEVALGFRESSPQKDFVDDANAESHSAGKMGAIQPN